MLSPDYLISLSVELQNSAVIMTVNMGNGNIVNVTNHLLDYALCNNKWHNLTAIFTTELTINVDGVSKSWVLSYDEFLLHQMEAHLYIGGVPGTLSRKFL